MHVCDRIAGTVYRIDGVFGDYLKGVSEQWLKTAPIANPATPAEYSADVDWLAGDNSLVFALDTNHGNARGVYMAEPRA